MQSEGLLHALNLSAPALAAADSPKAITATSLAAIRGVAAGEESTGAVQAFTAAEMAFASQRVTGL